MNFGRTHGTGTTKGKAGFSNFRSFACCSPCRGGWSNPGVILSEVTV